MCQNTGTGGGAKDGPSTIKKTAYDFQPTSCVCVCVCVRACVRACVFSHHRGALFCNQEYRISQAMAYP
jgi:hypothetical protein